MARNPSPTTELSLTFESLRLGCERQTGQEQPTGEEGTSSKDEVFWRHNESRTDQLNHFDNTSIASLTCNNNNEEDTGFVIPNNAHHHQVAPPTCTECHRCMCTIQNDQWRHHLINNNNNNQQRPTCTCDCHQQTLQSPLRSCDCHMIQGTESQDTPHQGGSTAVLSCRQEALYYNDVSVEELAGYLDELLHIPKPMSVMAELMYT